MRRLGAIKIFRIGRAAPDAPAMSMMESDPASLMAAGDLNGDKRLDVLDLRQSPYSNTVPNTLGVTARDGRTGRPLWHRVISGAVDDEMTVMVEPLGSHGQPGVLVVDVFQTYSGSVRVSSSLRLRALSGRTGRLVWSRTITGTYGTGNAQASVPNLEGVLHDVKGPTNDVLVTLETTVTEPISYRAVPELVSGADGSLHQPGRGYSTETDRSPEFLPLADVDGDGLADILAVVPGSAGFVKAEKGHSGAAIWTNSAVHPVAYGTSLTALGRYSHRNFPDIALSVSNTSTGNTDISVLQGRNGHLVWARSAPSLGLYLLGKAGKHLVPAVGVLSHEDTSTATTTTNSLDFKAVTAANKALYDKHVSVSVTDPPGTFGTGSGSGIGPLGDVEPDGSMEQLVQLEADAEAPGNTVIKNLNGYLDGRYGKFHKVTFNSGAVGSLHKGNGMDLLAVKLVKGRPQITARKGSTTKRYYQRTVSGLHGIDAAWVTGLRVSGQACSDISFSTLKGSQNILGVLSARGAWLWSLSFTATQSTGGTLRHYKKPKHYCV